MLLILSVIPVILFENIATKPFTEAYGDPLLQLTVSIGVYILVRNGVKASAYSKLLQEQDYFLDKKTNF